MALVQAVLQAYSLDWPLESSISTLAYKRVLEINTAGNLTSTLRTLPFHRLVEYPNVDMQSMPFADGEFDLIIHSDTLEHVADPKQALRECHRVLCDGGTMCFTVPIVLGRLSRSRLGMEASYHGSGTADFLVHSEFGSDVWTLLLASGFSSCTMTALELPSAIAITSRKEARRG
jgi:SAM-dependent methyltransferase